MQRREAVLQQGAGVDLEMTEDRSTDEEIFTGEVVIGDEVGDVHECGVTGGEMYDRSLGCPLLRDCERFRFGISLESHVKLGGKDRGYFAEFREGSPLG